MRKPITLSILLFNCIMVFSQNNYPWNRPLKMAWSDNGITFDTPVVFQDSSGVPSVIRWKGDTLVCAFQWFRQPMNSITWDRVAVKFSYNAGITWTPPTPIVVNGIPGNYQRPFDPTLTVINNNSLRIYFSSSNGMPAGGLTSIVDTYSAISSDGINYHFETGARVDDAIRPVIDPAVIYFNGMWHYAAPAGAPQDGAFHYTSQNGIDFISQVKYISDHTHNWLGNFMLNNANELRFYGSGQKIWYNSSSDGFFWQGYVNTSLMGGDPSVVKMENTRYLAIYVGETYNNVNVFNCGDTLVDVRDGQKYTTVQIGKDCWMKQNLNFGQMVPSVTSVNLHSDQFNNGKPEKYAYNNDVSKLPVYGGLYEWNELMNYTNGNGAQGLCLAGWHISTDGEWQNLLLTAGAKMSSSSGGRGGNALKITGEGSGAGTGTNKVGFSAKHSGDRDGFGIFNGLTRRSIFWTSTQANQTQAYHYTLWADNDTIQRLALGSNTGFACRCVKNSSNTGIYDNTTLVKPIKVFPNPFTDIIRCKDTNGSEEYELMGSSGQIIWKGMYIEQQNFSKLPQGLYLLKVNYKTSRQIIKLVKH